MNCGCCGGVASGYGCAVWCTYGAATAWCTSSTRNGTVRGGGARSDVAADGERFCFSTSRSWFGIRIAKISPKKLGDYNCLITGI